MRTAVTGRTRAPRDGRDIFAPCGHTERVYHFRWDALLCRRCGRDHQKTDYLTEGTS